MNDILRRDPDGRIKILDIGCGDGPFMKSALTAGIDADCIGFDISINMLKMAKNSLDCSRVQLLAADGFRMPLRPEAKFDLIHIDSVLHHLIGKTRDDSARLTDSFCRQLIDRLSENGRPASLRLAWAPRPLQPSALFAAAAGQGTEGPIQCGRGSSSSEPVREHPHDANCLSRRTVLKLTSSSPLQLRVHDG